MKQMEENSLFSGVTTFKHPYLFLFKLEPHF